MDSTNTAAAEIASQVKDTSNKASVSSAPSENARKIVIAVDASQHSKSAFVFAADKVLRPSDDVIILYVISPSEAPLSATGYFSLTSTVNEADRKKELASSFLLEEYKSLAQEKNVTCKILLEHGDPRDIIVKVTERESADLLVVGSHGRGLAQRLLLGSVSDYCSHHCSCPVLIYRSKA